MKHIVLIAVFVTPLLVITKNADAQKGNENMDFQKIHRAKIIVTETYKKEMKGTSQRYKYFTTLSKSLKYAGIETNDTTYDMIASIDVEGEPGEAGRYGGGVLLHGAFLKCTVTFDINGKKYITHLSNKEHISFHERGQYDIYDRAARGLASDFMKAVYNPFGISPVIYALADDDGEFVRETERVLDKIDRKWRKTPASKNAVPLFIAALKDSSKTIWEGAVGALRIIKDKQAIEPLIQSLKYTYIDAKTIAWSLQVITGADFGTDFIKWSQWWEENKSKEL